MSLYESQESNGSISLKDLFDNSIDINGIGAKIDINEIIFAACRGGWPSSLNAKSNIKPSNLLIGEKPRLIVEWQEAPTLWDPSH